MENERYMLHYEIKKYNNTIKILGEEFVRNNKNKGRIIYNNKIYPLQSLFQLEDIKSNKLKIQIILSKNCYKKSSMFKDCSSLLEIKFYKNIYNKEDLLFNKENNIYIRPIIDNNIYDDSKWETKISTMNEIFSNCSSLISIPDISYWDTSNVIDMNKIFYNCKNLSSLPDITKWNYKNVIYTNNMFDNSSFFSLLPDLSKIKIYDNILNYLLNFIPLMSSPNLSGKSKMNFINNFLPTLKEYESIMSLSEINKNETKNISMNSVNEKYCSIFNLIYDIRNKRKITIFGSFFVYKNKKRCKIIINNKLYSLTDKYKISSNNKKILKIKLIISENKLINLNNMFDQCKSLKKFYAKSPKYKKANNYILEKMNKYNSDQQKEKVFNKMVKSSLYNIKFHLIYQYISANINSENERDKINGIIFRSHDFLFQSSRIDSFEFKNDNLKEYNSLNSLASSKIIKRNDIIGQNVNSNKSFNYFKLSLFNPSKRNIIKPIDLSYMFYKCSSLTSIFGLSYFDTSKVINMAHIFEVCSLLKTIIDISQWRLDKVTDITYMFAGCSSLESLPDISKWNTNNIKKMSGIFLNCSILISLPDISKWNINKVESVNELFLGCSSLISLPDISIWNTSNILNMSLAFYNCSSLISLPDISKWNTHNVYNMNGLFKKCSSLLSLPDISKWNIDNAIIIREMFYNCSSLKSLPDISK